MSGGNSNRSLRGKIICSVYCRTSCIECNWSWYKLTDICTSMKAYKVLSKAYWLVVRKVSMALCWMINSVYILHVLCNFACHKLYIPSIHDQRTIWWGMFQNKKILGKDAWKLGRKSALFSKAGELKCVQKCLITINSWLLLQIFQYTSLWNTGTVHCTLCT